MLEEVAEFRLLLLDVGIQQIEADTARQHILALPVCEILYHVQCCIRGMIIHGFLFFILLHHRQNGAVDLLYQ